LRVGNELHVIIKIAESHWRVVMLVPPFFEQLSDHQAAAVQFFDLADALDRVLAP
jgi:hypothetical protein